MKVAEKKTTCKQCGKEISNYKYFCDIECEIKYTDVLNNQNNKA